MSDIRERAETDDSRSIATAMVGLQAVLALVFHVRVLDDFACCRSAPQACTCLPQATWLATTALLTHPSAAQEPAHVAHLQDRRDRRLLQGWRGRCHAPGRRQGCANFA